MQITRLRLCNFRQHESTVLELGPGLTGIVGPNGAGKTTLLEAVAWAMYGMPAARGTRESIRRRGAPPRSKCEVELDFALGAHRYRVVRTLTGAELFQDGEPAPIANSIQSVTDKVTRLLGMTREEFFNTYFTGQKELAVMAAMSAPERAQFLSRVLGYERIRTAQDRLRERRSALRARHEALEGSLPDPSELEAEGVRVAERLAAATHARTSAAEALAVAESELAAAAPRWDAAQQLRETAAKLESEHGVLQARLQAGAERLATLEGERDAARAASSRLGETERLLAPLAELRVERDELERRAAAVSARADAAAQADALRHRRVDLERRLAELPSADAIAGAEHTERDVRARLAAATLQANERRTAWVRDAQDAQTKREGLLAQFQELKQQRTAIMEAGRDGTCPTCSRPLGGEFEAVLGVLDRQLDDVLVNGNYYKQRIEQLREEPADLEALERDVVTLEREVSAAVGRVSTLQAASREAAAARAELDRVDASLREAERLLGADAAEYDRARHEIVRARLLELEPLSLQAERLRASAEREAALAGEAETLGATVTSARAELDGLAARLRGLGYSEKAFHDARVAAEHATQARRHAELALVRARSECTGAEEAARSLERRRVERAEREAEIRRVGTELALHQELDRALVDLRTDLNAGLRPELSELASAFVRDLTNGRYTDLELDEQYVPTLLDDGDPKTVISGGEEDIANLALRLAISQMIADRAGQPLSLLILDEIFGSLDESRRASVVELLRSLADRFPQVILITHIDAVREGFDRIVRVGLDQARGVAVVQEEPLAGHDAAA
jgi:exonuclease SbcC